MRGGQLRHRIKIQETTRTADAGGGQTDDWNTILEPWCEIQPLTARERFHSQQIAPQSTHQVTMRYHEGISEKHRVVFVPYGKTEDDQRTFRILGITNPEERNRELVLLCEEVKQRIT